MLSIIVPFTPTSDYLETLRDSTLDPNFEIISGRIGGFPFRRVDIDGCSYVRAANIAAAAARGDEMLFVESGFWISTALFRQAGGFNEHFLESCHVADLCRRLNIAQPPDSLARNHIDELLLSDLWPDR